MELRFLRYFLAVVREQNITAAAQSLHVTQPTLSKQLMEPEYELGTKLFERGRRNIRLTEEGEYLRRHAQEIVELADKMQAAFRPQGGTLMDPSLLSPHDRRIGRCMEKRTELFALRPGISALSARNNLQTDIENRNQNAARLPIRKARRLCLCI